MLTPASLRLRLWLRIHSYSQQDYVSNFFMINLTYNMFIKCVLSALRLFSTETNSLVVTIRRCTLWVALVRNLYIGQTFRSKVIRCTTHVPQQISEFTFTVLLSIVK